MIEKIKIRAGSGVIEGDLTVGGKIYNPEGNPLEIAGVDEIDALFDGGGGGGSGSDSGPSSVSQSTIIPQEGDEIFQEYNYILLNGYVTGEDHGTIEFGSAFDPYLGTTYILDDSGRNILGAGNWININEREVNGEVVIPMSEIYTAFLPIGETDCLVININTDTPGELSGTWHWFWDYLETPQPQESL